jgi:sugar lactone lactonase YvrE
LSDNATYRALIGNCDNRGMHCIRAGLLVILLFGLHGAAVCQQARVITPRTGDGGPALKAEIDGPASIAFDREGNLYIYELSGEAIRRVDARSRIITTVVSGWPPGKEPRPNGFVGSIEHIAFDPQGRLLFSEFTEAQLRLLDLRTGRLALVAGHGGFQSNGDGGPAAQAGILPEGFAFDHNGNIFVCDAGYYIRRIDAASGIISTVAGTGKNGFAGDGGIALAAQMSMPISIALDRFGNIYFTEDTSNCIRRIDAATGIIETVAGSGPTFARGRPRISYTGEGGPATRAQLPRPEALAFDRDENLLFATDGRICRIDRQGNLHTIAGNGRKGFSGDGGPVLDAEIAPSALGVDGHGNLFIAEYENNRVRRVDTDAGIITTVVGNGLPVRPKMPRPD